MSPRTLSPADRSIAEELRQLRKAADVNQDEAAAFLGVSTQQYGKYERAEDRISAARYKALKEFLLAKAAARGGLSEESVDYAAGPASHRHGQPEPDAVRKAWNDLKRAGDAFVQALEDRKR